MSQPQLITLRLAEDSRLGRMGQVVTLALTPIFLLRKTGF